MKRVVILGATKGMGRALARVLAERGDQLFVLGREPEELKRTVADLEARSREVSTVGHAVCDLADTASFAPALEAAAARLGGIDVVVVSAAMFALQDALEADIELCERLVHVNFSATIVFCEQARKQLLATGGGTLCVFSSVAGDRGRKPVAIYGACKAGLSHYLESLDHKYREAGLNTVCVKPGFVKTGMTAGLKPPPFAGEPEQVALGVSKAIDRGTPVFYTPPMWRWVMLVIRNLPRAAMRRVGF